MQGLSVHVPQESNKSELETQFEDITSSNPTSDSWQRYFQCTGLCIFLWVILCYGTIVLVIFVSLPDPKPMDSTPNDEFSEERATMFVRFTVLYIRVVRS